MIVLEHPTYLWGLLLLPILLLIFTRWIRRGRKRMQRFGDHSLMSRLTQHFSIQQHSIRLALGMLVLALLIVAWSNPQSSTLLENQIERRGDVYIALDVSVSMLAKDMAPSRLERAQQTALSLVKALSGNRIGLIYFAGSAFVQTPLTQDYSVLNAFIQSANTNMLSAQGTRIEDAIELSIPTEQEGQGKRILIILSDGESENEAAVQKAKEAYQQGLITYTIGVGSPQGSRIEYTNKRGERMYKRDKQGQVVVSKLNEPMLQAVAQAGHGQYWPLMAASELEQGLVRAAAEFDREWQSEEVGKRMNTQYEWLVWPAFILLLVYLWQYPLTT